MNNKAFKKGEVIFRESEFAATMYDILSGKVGIIAKYGTAEEKQLAVLGEQEIFGEMGLIECYPRSATAIALEDGTVVEEISAAEFSDYFKDKPTKVFLVMKQMSNRLRETTENYTEACRTVYEAVEAEKAGRKWNRWLDEHLKFFYEVYRNSGRVH